MSAKELSSVKHTSTSSPPSDALVLFGVTGDLAHEMIFPALYAMAKRATSPAR